MVLLKKVHTVNGNSSDSVAAIKEASSIIINSRLLGFNYADTKGERIRCKPE
jgi:hypothetical protein